MLGDELMGETPDDLARQRGVGGFVRDVEAEHNAQRRSCFQPLGKSLEQLLPFVDGAADEQDLRLCVFDQGLKDCGGVRRARATADGEVADFERKELVGGGRRTVVAQTCSLLYRGFPIRWRGALGAASDLSAACRLEVGDTAGWKPALRCAASRAKWASMGARVLRTMGSVNERGV
jgi:hypothetical protein